MDIFELAKARIMAGGGGKGFYSTEENDAGGTTYAFRATESDGDSGGDFAFNIHYGTEAPTDTSKLWVKTSEPSEPSKPSKVVVAHDFEIVKAEEGAALTTLSEKLPVGMSGFGCGSFGTKIYLFGGYSGSRLDTIMRFDTTTETHTTLSEKLPIPLNGFGCATVGTKIYLFGGYAGDSYLDTVLCFDTESESLTTLSVKMPSGLSGMSCASVGTKIYLFGGTGARETGVGTSTRSTIIRLDTENETFTTLSTQLPAPSSGVGIASIGTKIYLFGGFRSISAGHNTNVIMCFDTEIETLTTLSTYLPQALNGISCGVIGSEIYLFGGQLYQSSCVDTIMRFDADTNELDTLSEKLPIVTKDARCTAIGTNIYMLGGYDGKNYLDAINRFGPFRYVLSAGALQIKPKTGGITCLLADTNAFSLKIGVDSVYKGGTNDQPELVEAYLYNETTSAWELN